MKKLGTIILALFFGTMPLPVLAEESSDSTIPVVFGVLALIGIVIFLIIGITVAVIARNTDENEDGL